jgi:hypothetical protein
MVRLALRSPGEQRCTPWRGDVCSGSSPNATLQEAGINFPRSGYTPVRGKRAAWIRLGREMLSVTNKKRLRRVPTMKRRWNRVSSCLMHDFHSFLFGVVMWPRDDVMTGELSSCHCLTKKKQRRFTPGVVALSYCLHIQRQHGLVIRMVRRRVCTRTRRASRSHRDRHNAVTKVSAAPNSSIRAPLMLAKTTWISLARATSAERKEASPVTLLPDCDR